MHWNFIKILKPTLNPGSSPWISEDFSTLKLDPGFLSQNHGFWFGGFFSYQDFKIPRRYGFLSGFLIVLETFQ
jgi:hypothetical protein